MLYRRHIFLRTLRAGLGGTGLFVAVLLAGNGLKDAMPLLVAGQMSLPFFFQTLLALLPSVVSYALPLGMLVAILLTFGRMAADGEVLALRAAGVAPFQLAIPVLWLAIAAAFCSLAIDLIHAPRALYAYRQGLRRIVAMDPLRFLRPGHFVQNFPGLILHAGGRDGDEFLAIHIWELRPGGAVAGCIRADGGRLELADGGDSLLLSLRDGSMERMDGGEVAFFRHCTLPLALRHGLPADELRKQLKHMDLFELLAARNGATDDPSLADAGDRRQRRLDYLAANLVLQRHLAMASSIVCLALLAVPLAMRLARTELSLALALVLALGYYFALTAISWLDGSTTLRADLLIWLPNAVLLAVSGLCWHLAARR
ncbi:MAG: LptF/LptG family permease [Puniceicoccales bacterium]|jgi:lipopolysaccharide export system permease protein|nr:LptF/LptG family permease [Puniceicoccales bacterium]